MIRAQIWFPASRREDRFEGDAVEEIIVLTVAMISQYADVCLHRFSGLEGKSRLKRPESASVVMRTVEKSMEL
jgi:hypothetical protein